MKKFKEATGTIVFAFGRFNPPTTGHEKLINKVKQVAGSNPYKIYPSFSQNPKKDPLPHSLKVAYMRKMFRSHAKNIVADKNAITAMHIVVKLYDEGYRNLVMVAGSDRVKEFDSLLKRYNGVSGKRHGYYKFDMIDVVSAGERDPDAEGVSGMSASKMRAAAYKGDLESFKTGLPTGFKEAEKLYKDVRKYMGLREERNMGLMTDYEQLRDAYLTGKVWNIDDLIEARGITGKIIRRGTNYIAFVDESNKVHKAWLHEITIDERPDWFTRAKYSLKRVTHPKEYEHLIIKYVDGLEKGHGKPSVKRGPGDIQVRNKDSLVAYIAKKHGKTATGRSLRQYINKLVKKGDLPKEAEVRENKKEKRKGYNVLGTGGAFASGEAVKEALTMRIKDRKNKYVFAYGQKVKVDGDVYDTEGVTKAQVLVLKGRKGEKVLSKKELEQGLKNGTIKMIDAGSVSQESVREWFESNETRAKYQMQYEDNWWWKLNETHDVMLEKLGICCEDCLTEEDPCWDGYKQVGMKMKNGKKVPNCVPEEITFKEFQLRNAWGEITEKDNEGKELNNPSRGDKKKYKVYVKNDKGNVVKVEFGDPNMEIKRDDPERRKSFRARHNCENPGPKWKARYWSCKFWSAKSVTDLMKG